MTAHRSMASVALLAGVLLASSGAATAANLLLRGSIECSAWSRAREAKSSVVMERYLEGVLNGMALGSGLDFWNWGSAPLGREQVHVWMDKYCQRLPNGRVDVGATELMNDRTTGAWKQFISKREKTRTSPISN